MQQMIVLSTADGVVDMTPQAIAARTSIPFEIIVKGLKILAEPDPYTRTPGEEGRRIALIDEHRPWGWRLVNHGKYSRLRNMAEKRQADRDRIAEKRSNNKDVAIESRNVADVAHADADTDVKKITGAIAPVAPGDAGTRLPECPQLKIVEAYHEILKMCPRVSDWTPERQKIMRARWRERALRKKKGYRTEEDGMAFWKRYFSYVAESLFLTGRTEGRDGKAPFVADLEWLVRPKNFVKVIEGHYHR
jgi:hypothetical protein